MFMLLYSFVHYFFKNLKADDIEDSDDAFRRTTVFLPSLLFYGDCTSKCDKLSSCVALSCCVEQKCTT